MVSLSGYFVTDQRLSASCGCLTVVMRSRWGIGDTHHPLPMVYPLNCPFILQLILEHLLGTRSYPGNCLEEAKNSRKT